MNFIIEELKDPVKNLPRAIAISLVLVTLVYVFTNVAFYTILSPIEVMGSTAVAVTFAERSFGMFAWTIPGINTHSEWKMNFVLYKGNLIIHFSF